MQTHQIDPSKKWYIICNTAVGLMLEKHLILHINNTGIFENRGVNIPISRWYEQWWYNS